MIARFKGVLYFPIASYFKFFAAIQLKIWKPRIIVIVGSTGKTTLLHMIESQIGNQAIYSHLANSSFGIPFHILGLQRKTLTINEWPGLFLLAPINAFKNLHKQKLYIVEADCDRPNEGKFLASLLNPEITIWLSTSKTHTQNFDSPVEENIAKEFGYFLEYASKYCIVNGDSKLIVDQLKRTKNKIQSIAKKNHLQNYQVLKNGTNFKIDNMIFNLNYLLPEDNFYLIKTTIELLKQLEIPFDSKFTNLTLPAGRSTMFAGIKNTTIIDSSYNATPASVAAILHMYKKYPGKKWLILGDMIELGKEEQIEHERLAPQIAQCNLVNIILVGPRVSKYTYPKLKVLTDTSIQTFINPKEALDYLKDNIKGEEVLLFKGARFLEGVIEHILQNKDDVQKLCRRGKKWQHRRREWELE